MADQPSDSDQFAELMQRTTAYGLRDLDLDAFADGIAAHRDGRPFHDNPHGHGPSLRRLSWHLGWNERALRIPP